MRAIVCISWMIVLVIGLSFRAEAGDVTRRASERFAVADVQETPSFRQHVVPLLGRLGCNGRACHGSFQGQGGFRLSLFGYDFAADHEALALGDSPRVSVSNPSASLILRKPTLAVDHEGGKRFEQDSWQYRLLLRWIQAGAVGAKEGEAEFASLEVTPKEILFRQSGETAQLSAVVTWSDGSREDVTPLCRFRSNDESIATIDAAGLVTSTGKGDTHVVAFYDNGVVPVQVLLPWTEKSGPNYPAVACATRIDEIVVEKLRKLGIVPAERCSDAEFLRRVSLDMTGSLPTPEEVRSFSTDASPNKRSQKIDELLSRPTYAAWWATRLCDLTGNSEQGGPEGAEKGVRKELAEQWYDWIYRRVEKNTPYDELAAGIVLATSRKPGQSDDEYFAETSGYFRTENPLDFAARDTMPHFWSRGRFVPPVTLRFSYAFLGARLECAECHKHPFDQWTKHDFEQFKAFFDGVRFTGPNRTKAKEIQDALGLTGDQDSGQFQRTFADLAKSGKIVPWKEVLVSGQKKPSKSNKPSAPAGRVITPKLLGGDEVLASEYADCRQPLMDWLRQPDNPYFARAFVNRVWANYFNVGIIDPPDDLNLANPPSNEALLDYLAERFVEQGFDMKWLHREIANSDTYQRSWRPNSTNRLDTRNFSRSVVRRLPAEVTYDAIVQAAAGREQIESLQNQPRNRAIGVTSGYSRAHPASYAMTLFGKPPRAAVCDCERSNEPTLLQALYVRNDEDIFKLLDQKQGWIAEATHSSALDHEQLVNQAYLRTLSREPTESERLTALRHLREADKLADGLRDLMWALINTKEFIVNH